MPSRSAVSRDTSCIAQRQSRRTILSVTSTNPSRRSCFQFDGRGRALPSPSAPLPSRLRRRRRRASRSSRGFGVGAAGQPEWTPDSTIPARGAVPDMAHVRLGSQRPDAYEKNGVGAFVRRVRARRLGLAAREKKLVPLHWRRSAAAIRTRTSAEEGSVRVVDHHRNARLGHQPRATRERRLLPWAEARGKGCRRSNGERKEKAGKWEAKELCLRPRTTSSAAAIVDAPHTAIGQKNLSYYSRIAVRSLGRAVKDALRVCEWKTRVEYLVESQTTLS